MRIILIVFLTMMTLNAVNAQTRVMTRDEANKEKFHPDLLPITYERGSASGLAFMIEKVGGTVFKENMNPGIWLMTQLFVGPQGTIDYLIFEVVKPTTYNIDSLNVLLKSAFVEAAAGIKVNKPLEPFQTQFANSFGKRVITRDVRAGDSAVVTMKDALAIVDTLKIKRFYLNQLDLKTVPDVIYRFSNLEELYLGGNGLTSVKIDLGRFRKLKRIDLSGNRLTDNSIRLSRNKSVKILNLRENKLTDIPAAARSCRKLNSLWMGGNALTGLSSRSFRKLKKVTDLNFYKSDLAELPAGIKKMRNLEVLDLYYNKLETLPSSITKLKKLTHLALSNNKLTALPEKLDKLKHVHTIYAHHNHLSAVPPVLGNMQQLRILDLGYNWLYHFPDEIVALKNLQELDLSGNNFADFPVRLLEIQKLDKLYLRGNPFIGENAETQYSSQLEQLKSRNIEVFY